MADAALFKRGTIWWAWIFGERRSTRCRDKEAARRRARELERDAADPEGAAKAQAGLSDALGLLIADTESRVNAKPPRASIATLGFHRKEAAVLLAALAPEFDPESPDPSKDLPLRQVTAARADDFIARRRKGGAKDSTIHKDLTTWRKSMKLAKRAGIWGGEIERVFPIAFAPDYKPRERWMKQEEFLLLLRDAEALDQPESRRAEVRRARLAVLAMVAFMVATSAEWGAVQRARLEDVNEDFSIVHVRGTKDAQKGGNRDRLVPIVLVGHAYLLQFAVQNATQHKGLLFRANGNMRRALAAACDRAGIARLSPNDLRRTHAQWLRRAGVRAADLAPVMGHADSRMVERVYGKVTPIELAPMLRAQIMAHAASLEPPPYKFSTAPRKARRSTGKNRTKSSLENPRVGGSIPSLGTKSPCRGPGVGSSREGYSIGGARGRVGRRSRATRRAAGMAREGRCVVIACRVPREIPIRYACGHIRKGDGRCRRSNECAYCNDLDSKALRRVFVPAIEKALKRRRRRVFVIELHGFATIDSVVEARANVTKRLGRAGASAATRIDFDDRANPFLRLVIVWPSKRDARDLLATVRAKTFAEVYRLSGIYRALGSLMPLWDERKAVLIAARHSLTAETEIERKDGGQKLKASTRMFGSSGALRGLGGIAAGRAHRACVEDCPDCEYEAALDRVSARPATTRRRPGIARAGNVIDWSQVARSRASKKRRTA